MPHTRKTSFYPKPTSLSNKLFFDNSSATISTDGLKSRLWIKNFSTCRILNLKKYNASDFGLKRIQRVRFLNESFSTCQISKLCMHSKITFWFILLRENDQFYIFCAFFESMILNWKFHYVTDFELKKKTTRQIFKQNFYISSDFELKFFRAVRFWNKNFTMCHVILKKFRPVRFQNKMFSSFSTLKSNLLPPHVLFASFSSI